MKKCPRILVSILSFNNPEASLLAIESLLCQDYKDFEIINIENAATPAAKQAVRDKYPQILCLETSQNLGYSGGNNMALDYARENKFDSVLVLNDDVILPADVLTRFAEAEAACSDAALLGGTEKNPFSGAIISSGGELLWWLGRVLWRKCLPSGSLPVPVFCPQGACIYFTGLALRNSLRFDDSLGLYGEEMELGYTLKGKGLRAYVHPAVVYYHPSILRAGGGLSSKNAYYIARNRIWVSKKHLTIPKFIVFTTFYLSEMLAKCAYRIFCSPKGFVLNIICGAYNGFFPDRVKRLPI